MNIEKFTISRNDSFMEGWPDLIKTQSGRLIAVYNECVGHGNRDHTHIAMRTSDDNGNTWSGVTYIGEETFQGNQYNSIRINQLSDGRIILLCDRVKEREINPGCVLHLWESCDDGATWTEAQNTGIHGYCSDKVRELPDGSLLVCISFYNEATGKTEIFAHKSKDGGKTWSKGVLAASSPDYTFIEPAALTLSDGRICVFLRENSFNGYNGFVVYSDDFGESFYGLSEIPVKGMHRPFIGKLNDGRILLSCREFLEGDFRGKTLKMCIFTENELNSATEFETHYIDRDTSENPDTGYSAWVQLEDGSLLMANYITDDAPFSYIRGYKINL